MRFALKILNHAEISHFFLNIFLTEQLTGGFLSAACLQRKHRQTHFVKETSIDIMPQYISSKTKAKLEQRSGSAAEVTGRQAVADLYHPRKKRRAEKSNDVSPTSPIVHNSACDVYPSRTMLDMPDEVICSASLTLTSPQRVHTVYYTPFADAFS